MGLDVPSVYFARSVETSGKKSDPGELAHPALTQERRYNRSAAPMSPETRTTPVQKPGDATVVTGGCVLPEVVPGGAAGGVWVVSPGDTGIAVPGAVVATAGVTVPPGAGVDAGAPDDEDEELLEPEDDVAVAAGATTSRDTMLPLRMTSKVFVTNCVSLHRGSWMITVLPPGPTRVSWMMARGVDSTALIPSVFGMATFAYPISLSILASTSEPGISLLAMMSSIQMISLS